MVERPLILFGSPSIAEKEKRRGGATKYGMPSHERQVDRLEPQFRVLQSNIDKGGIFFQSYATSIEPEYTLVFETVGDPQSFFKAVKKLKETYPAIEWLMELSDDSMENTEDFYVINTKEERDDTKQLTTKLFCIMSDRTALAQMISIGKRIVLIFCITFP